jgi:hypothetical protein
MRSSTPTSKALAILVSVSIVGFWLTPFSILTIVFKDESARRATFSSE